MHDPDASEGTRTATADFASREERHISVLIVAGLEAHGADGLCRVRNLSDRGAMIDTLLPVAEGDAVRLRLRSGAALGGEVRWARSGQAGLRFDDEGAMAAIQAKAPVPMRAGDADPAHPRFARAAAATVKLEHVRRPAALLDISLLDARVCTDGFAPPVGLPCHLGIAGLGEHLATFVPTPDGEALARFAQPLPYRLLAAWLAGFTGP